MRPLIALVWTLLFGMVSFAGTSPVPLPSPIDNTDKELQNSKWEEVQSIIDDIKTQNPPDTVKLRIRLGAIQTITNNQGSSDGIQFGQSGASLGFGLDGSINLFGNLGLEARETYTQNLLPAPSSPNQGQAYISWFDAGPRYTFYLDSTRLDNNVVIKVLYHENYNNLILDPTLPTFLWVNFYSGVSGSVERNIPITNKLGIMGMFDLLQIFNTSSPTINSNTSTTNSSIAKSGYGFEIHAEVYYKILWGKMPMRMGLMYWQQGNQSELDDSIKSAQGRNSYFQTSRAIFGTMSMLF